MAAKIQPTERQSAGAAAGADDLLQWRALNDLNDKLSSQFDLLRSWPHQEPAKDLNDVLCGISHRLDDGTSERKAAYDRLLAIENEMNKLSSQFDLLRSRPHQEPAKDLNDVLSGISHRLDDGTSERKAVYDRLLAIENEMKRRGSRGGFARYLVAICIGVAATLAWQSYGEVPKQVIATKAPELGWSPETKQMIASWVQQLGWTKPPAVPESTAVQPSVPETQVATVAQTVPAAVVPKAPTAPSLDPVQVQQMAQSLAALAQTVDQLAASQDQMVHQIDRLQTSNQEILEKIPAPPPPRPIAAPARKPARTAPLSSPAPIQPHLTASPVNSARANGRDKIPARR